jgi:hypothetical protein
MTATSMEPRLRHRRAGGDSREAICCSGHLCAGHDWLVTAPQMRPCYESVDRVPWGTYHLKENGGAMTACGMSAVTWHVFWGRAADPTDSAACPECIRRVQLRRQYAEGYGSAS